MILKVIFEINAPSARLRACQGKIPKRRKSYLATNKKRWKETRRKREIIMTIIIKREFVKSSLAIDAIVHEIVSMVSTPATSYYVQEKKKKQREKKVHHNSGRMGKKR